jgi:hypothetical protein
MIEEPLNPVQCLEKARKYRELSKGVKDSKRRVFLEDMAVIWEHMAVDRTRTPETFIIP